MAVTPGVHKLAIGTCIYCKQERGHTCNQNMHLRGGRNVKLSPCRTGLCSIPAYLEHLGLHSPVTTCASDGDDARALIYRTREK